MAKKFLTLNIGASQIELAEYEEGAKGALTLVNYGTAVLAAPLDGGNADTILSPALLEIVREKGIRPGRVAVSVPGQMVFPKFAAIPMVGEFDKMVRNEIEQGIPFPIDEMVCDQQILGDTENGDKSVMIVAAKVDQIEAITSAVSAAGFTPDIVDVAPIALTNAVRAAGQNGDGCMVLLDMGAKTTSLVISEGDKLYTRSIPVAGNAITKEIGQALGCSPEEAERVKRELGYVSLGGVTEDDDEVAYRVSKVCRVVLTRLHAEISRSINFYRSQQGGGVPVKLYLTGGTALLPQIDQFFSESLQIDVEFFNPFNIIGVSPKIDSSALESDAAVLAATAGLALHHVGRSRFRINLLPPSLVAERAERARIPFLIVGGVSVVAALLLVMLAFDRETSVIDARAEGVQQIVTSLKGDDAKVKSELAKYTAAKTEADSVRSLVAARSVAVQRLNAVRASLAPGMWIDRWESGKVSIRYWKNSVKTSGAKTVGEVVVDKLRGKLGVIVPESVKIADMSAIGKDGDVEQFTVEMKFK